MQLDSCNTVRVNVSICHCVLCKERQLGTWGYHNTRSEMVESTRSALIILNTIVQAVAPFLPAMHNGLPSAKEINGAILGVSKVELSRSYIQNQHELKDFGFFLIVIEIYNSIEASL